MEKDPKIFLGHILESIEAIERYANGQTFDTFLQSTKDQDAVIRRIEIIGEAVKNLPEQFKRQYPDVPWQDAADMRDKLIHEYFDVDAHIAWDTIQNDLPEFKRKIEEILGKR